MLAGGDREKEQGRTLSGVPAYVCLVMLIGGLGLCIASGMVAPAWFEARGLSWLALAGFGLVFVSVGLMALLSGEVIGLVFMLVGLAVGGGAAYVTYAPRDNSVWFMENAVPVMLLSMFVFVGFAFLIVPPVIRRKKLAKYTEEVRATVVSKVARWHRNSEGRRRRSYYLTWRYSYRGEWYTYRSDRGRNPEKRDTGDEGVLRVDPSNPSDAWEEYTVFEKVFFVIMGLLFAGAGGAAMYMFLFLRG